MAASISVTMQQQVVLAMPVLLLPSSCPARDVLSFRSIVALPSYSSSSRMPLIRMSAAPKKGSSSGPAINNLGDTLAQSIEDAQQACAGDDQSEECAAAWDEVENVSAAVSHQKAKNKGKGDPLEEFCEENPEADECRVYSD